MSPSNNWPLGSSSARKNWYCLVIGPMRAFGFLAGEVFLLLGYAILLELWLVELWLAHPEGEGPLEQWEPLRRLRALADGAGGYLAPLLHG